MTSVSHFCCDLTLLNIAWQQFLESSKKPTVFLSCLVIVPIYEMQLSFGVNFNSKRRSTKEDTVRVKPFFLFFFVTGMNNSTRPTQHRRLQSSRFNPADSKLSTQHRRLNTGDSTLPTQHCSFQPSRLNSADSIPPTQHRQLKTTTVHRDNTGRRQLRTEKTPQEKNITLL